MDSKQSSDDFKYALDNGPSGGIEKFSVFFTSAAARWRGSLRYDGVFWGTGSFVLGSQSLAAHQEP